MKDTTEPVASDEEALPLGEGESQDGAQPLRGPLSSASASTSEAPPAANPPVQDISPFEPMPPDLSNSSQDAINVVQETQSRPVYQPVEPAELLGEGEVSPSSKGSAALAGAYTEPARFFDPEPEALTPPHEPPQHNSPSLEILDALAPPSVEDAVPDLFAGIPDAFGEAQAPTASSISGDTLGAAPGATGRADSSDAPIDELSENSEVSALHVPPPSLLSSQEMLVPLEGTVETEASVEVIAPLVLPSAGYAPRPVGVEIEPDTTVGPLPLHPLVTEGELGDEDLATTSGHKLPLIPPRVGGPVPLGPVASATSVSLGALDQIEPTATGVSAVPAAGTNPALSLPPEEQVAATLTSGPAWPVEASEASAALEKPLSPMQVWKSRIVEWWSVTKTTLRRLWLEKGAPIWEAHGKPQWDQRKPLFVGAGGAFFLLFVLFLWPGWLRSSAPSDKPVASIAPIAPIARSELPSPPPKRRPDRVDNPLKLRPLPRVQRVPRIPRRRPVLRRQVALGTPRLQALPMATLDIATTPSQARIIIDGVDTTRRTPARFSYPAGSHRLTLLRTGYTNRSIQIRLFSKQALVLGLAMRENTRLRKVSVYIRSRPRRATIWINGRKTRRRTPARLRLRPGKYRLTLRRRRYRRYTRMFEVRPHQKSRVQVELVRR